MVGTLEGIYTFQCTRVWIWKNDLKPLPARYIYLAGSGYFPMKDIFGL
jgi:hypothetical protein